MKRLETKLITSSYLNKCICG